MNADLPLPALLAWSATLPAPMRLPSTPTAIAEWQAFVPAVVADLMETLTGTRGSRLVLLKTQVPGDPAATRELQAWIMAACHVCWHPALRQRADVIKGLERLMLQELPALSALVRVARLDAEEERREELVRRCLRALGRGVDGESPADAEERLRQVDSIERQHLVRMAMERQEVLQRAERLRRKAEAEAASKVSRE